MRVLVTPQEFKGSLTAPQAAAAIAAGVLAALPEAAVDEAPMADGGPGTVEALVRAGRGRFSLLNVDGPLGEPVAARWGRIDDGRTAVIEMAAAAGLVLLAAARRDPRRAATHGVGQLIQAALDAGVERILVGVGGSASNDGGAGAAVALGARLLDEDGRPLPPGGAALAALARIDVTGLDPRLRQTRITVLTDVKNPLLGPEGASAVYGPQKGADAATVAELERALANYAGIVERDLGVAVAEVPGAGAAGGLAAGLAAFGRAELVPGFEAVAEAIHLGRRIAQADVTITGEGALDAQSAYGKTVAGVAALCRHAGRPCLTVAGRLESVDIPGLADAEAATPVNVPEAEALEHAAEFVEAAARRLMARFLGAQ